MKLIIGLGNPEKKYQNTRHNLGQKIITEYLKTQKKCRLKENHRLSSKTCETGWGSDKKIFAISNEYMNNSGTTVQKISHFFKITSDNIYVLHDDLDLPVGDYKIQFDRGSAGHNGIKSIVDHLGTQQFNRIRIGIGKPHDIPVEDYVLQSFPPEEQIIINQLLPKIFTKINNL